MTQNSHSSLQNQRTALENRYASESHARLVFCSEADHIKYCIRSLLMTRRGERALYPEMGGSLMSFLFQQYQLNKIQTVKTEITRILETQEPRVRATTVSVEQDERNPFLISIGIQYLIRSSGELDTLAFKINA
jgi:phage baseplate assembly protein W